MAPEISETIADSNWLAKYKIEKRKAKVASWLHSFPPAQVRRKLSGSNLRTISAPVVYSLSKASLAAAKLPLQRVLSLDWAAVPRQPVLHLRSCMNIKAGGCPFITSISSGCKTTSQPTGLALTTIFLVTAF